MASPDEMSQAMVDFINRLSPEDNEGLLHVLQDSRTFLAEDMTDVIAILDNLKY